MQFVRLVVLDGKAGWTFISHEMGNRSGVQVFMIVHRHQKGELT
jgi:hypothetical protein